MILPKAGTTCQLEALEGDAFCSGVSDTNSIGRLGFGRGETKGLILECGSEMSWGWLRGTFGREGTTAKAISYFHFKYMCRGDDVDAVVCCGDRDGQGRL